MRRDELFRQTVVRLETVAGGTFDELGLLEASGHLRRLLLDEDPLVHQINRERLKRIEYEVSSEGALDRMQIEDGALFNATMDGFSPRLKITRSEGTERLKLPAFLKRRVAHVQGQDVTVQDAIKQIANIEGGVHPGHPRTDLEHLLHQTNASLIMGGYNAVASTLRGIGDVAVVVLKPLT